MQTEKIYPACRSLLGTEAWEQLISQCDDHEPQALLKILSEQNRIAYFPEFLSDLLRLEWNIYTASNKAIKIPSNLDRLSVNPSCQLLKFSWKNLPLLLKQDKDMARPSPVPGEEVVIIWKHPESGETHIQPASSDDLLVLKMVVEGIDAETVAREGDLPVGAVDAALERALAKGILISPASLIRRDPPIISGWLNLEDRFTTAEIFTLQWHITQACDLHCRHCYDRSSRPSLSLDEGVRILDELRNFCRSRFVRGQVTFTGGNPLLYKHFSELYRAAAERGFTIAILGNPAPPKRIEELISIEHPSHFQVSLEGLREHNDYIRGVGHFNRVIEFLGVLRNLGVFSMVMLTLTKENIDQIIPLAEYLRDRVDLFTFNRLSLVGEGANLQLPSRDKYKAFIEEYLRAAEENPIMGLKDNMFNILLQQKGLPSVGGCAGFGCGAAFNFITLLPDGEVHACRKLPSPIGNINYQSISDIYDSARACSYRAGSSSCRSCKIRAACGGCLAITYSHGLNIFENRDPYCFMD